MKYCVQCLQPDTRPNTTFNRSGICPACDYFERLEKVDWDERYLTLLDILSRYPRKKNHYYDCIIGVSGGKDSTRQALWLKEKLRLNPLLVCVSYPPEQVSERGVDNLSNLIELGFDVQVIAPAPVTWKTLVRQGFFRFSNWCKSTELALFSGVPRLAINYNIPLVFWGENPGLQLGGDLKTLGKTGYDGNNLRYMNTLNGGDMSWMLESGLEESDLLPYKYPEVDEFAAANLQIVYLGWFLGDWSMINNGLYSCLDGLRIRSDVAKNTGDLYGLNALDDDWVTMNQMIKYYKFGFGWATDYVNEEIRFNNLTREEGIAILEEFDGQCSDDYIESFCEYIEISLEEFWGIVRKNTNRDLFDISSERKRPVKKFQVGVGI